MDLIITVRLLLCLRLEDEDGSPAGGRQRALRAPRDARSRCAPCAPSLGSGSMVHPAVPRAHPVVPAAPDAQKDMEGNGTAAVDVVEAVFEPIERDVCAEARLQLGQC